MVRFRYWNDFKKDVIMTPTQVMSNVLDNTEFGDGDSHSPHKMQEATGDDGIFQ